MGYRGEVEEGGLVLLVWKPIINTLRCGGVGGRGEGWGDLSCDGLVLVKGFVVSMGWRKCVGLFL